MCIMDTIFWNKRKRNQTFFLKDFKSFKVFVPNIGESYITKSILENDNYIDILYDNNGNEVIFSSDGSRINNDEDDGIEIISLEDVPNPESEELF